MMQFNPTPNVSSRYGAPMGRHSFEMRKLTGKTHLRRILIDNGGYDSGGAYWGIGAPLFYAEDEGGTYCYFRAADRIAAKAMVIAVAPTVRFFR
jgi:hypothetical protein